MLLKTVYQFRLVNDFGLTIVSLIHSMFTIITTYPVRVIFQATKDKYVKILDESFETAKNRPDMKIADWIDSKWGGDYNFCINPLASKHWLYNSCKKLISNDSYNK